MPSSDIAPTSSCRTKDTATACRQPPPSFTVFQCISQTILKNVTAQEYAGRCHAQVTTERNRNPRNFKLRFLFPTWRSTKETACSTVTARAPKQASRRRTLDCRGMKIKQRLQYLILSISYPLLHSHLRRQKGHCRCSQLLLNAVFCQSN